jgi:hypothetical protein
LIAKIIVVGEALCDGGCIVGLVGVPVAVRDEESFGFVNGVQIPHELAVGTGDCGERAGKRRIAGFSQQRFELGPLDAVAHECFGQAELHEPGERGEWVGCSGVADVAITVHEQIKNIVVITAKESCAIEREEKLDHGTGIRSAVDIIADEDVMGVGIGGGDGAEQSAERTEHAVYVADDPVHDG